MPVTAKRLFRFLVCGLIAYLIFVLLIYFFQRDLLYFPDTNRVQPQSVDLHEVREITLKTPGGQRLFCWHGKPRDDQPTILFFHGNAGDVSNRHNKIRQLMGHGFGVFMVGYPGYGGSDGSPSEGAFREASKLAYEHLRISLDSKDIVIYGASLGSAVAVQLAASVPARALILEAPMSSILDVSKSRFPFLPVSLMLKDRYLSFEHVANIQMPLLILHGAVDHVIPEEHSLRLFDLAAEPKHRRVYPLAGHNNLYDFDVIDALTEFLGPVGTQRKK